MSSADGESALNELRAEGWQVEMTCQAAPVQLAGRIPDGTEFYFRSRHDDALLAIGGEDPAARGEWEAEIPFTDASWLTAEDGLPIIRRLFAEYMARPRGDA
jgi:hypothetical protein